MKAIFYKLLAKNNFIIFTLLFLIALFFNFNNKTLIVASFLYLFLAIWINKSVSKGLIFSFLLFNLILVGKTYEFLIIPGRSLAYGKNLVGYLGHYQYLIIGPNFFIGLGMFLWGTTLFFKKQIRIEKDSFLFLIFLILVFASSLFSLNFNISFFYSVHTFFLLPFYLILKDALIKDKNFLRTLLGFFLLLASYESIWALLQYAKRASLIPSLELINSISFESLDFDTQWFRPWASLSHPNDLANFLLPLAVFFFLLGYSKTFPGKNYVAVLMLSVLGLILALSRSAWLAFFLVSFLFIFIFEKRKHLSLNNLFKKNLLTIFVIFFPLLLYFIFPRIEKSFSTFSEGGSGLSRIELVEESLNLIFKYPLLGVGRGMSVLGMFLENPKGEMFYFPAPVHNFYLQMASEMGVPALLMFISFIAFILFKKRKTSEKDNFLIKNIALAGILALLLNGFFQPIYTTTMLYLIIFASIYYAQ